MLGTKYCSTMDLVGPNTMDLPGSTDTDAKSNMLLIVIHSFDPLFLSVYMWGFFSFRTTEKLLDLHVALKWANNDHYKVDCDIKVTFYKILIMHKHA